MSDESSEKDKAVSALSRMTAEQIREEIERLAQDGEGADRRWALKTLEARESLGSAFLPPPLNQKERIDRLIRVMRPNGPNDCLIALRRAFPRANMKVTDSPNITAEDLSADSLEIIARVTNLKGLYREFPAIKRHGIPSGFPSGRGVEAQLVWCKREAEKMLLERERLLTSGEEENGGKEETQEA